MIFHEGLMCHPMRLTYDFGAHAGIIALKDGDCCDMKGCIALFERIDAAVERIETFSGRNRDTVYALRDGRWDALAWEPETGTKSDQS